MIRPRASFAVVVAILFSAALFAEESIRNWAAPPLWSPAEPVADEGGELSAMGMEAVEGLPTAPLPFHAIHLSNLLRRLKHDLGFPVG